MAEFQSSMRQFSPNLPSIGNHFYPIYGAAGAFGTTTPEPTPEPYIDPTTPANVTVIKGKSAMLACVVREIGDAAVSTRFVGYASYPIGNLNGSLLTLSKYLYACYSLLLHAFTSWHTNSTTMKLIFAKESLPINLKTQKSC